VLLAIIMLDSRWVSPDGLSLRYCREGNEYRFPEPVAAWLIAMGYARCTAR